jgi:hypothetical protein
MSPLPPGIFPPPTCVFVLVRGLWLILFGVGWLGLVGVVIRHGICGCMFMQWRGW